MEVIADHRLEALHAQLVIMQLSPQNLKGALHHQ